MLFQLILAGAVVAVGIGAFVGSVRLILLAAFAVGLAGLAAGASPRQAAATFAVVLAVSLAAGALARLGRRVGAPPFTAGAIAASILWVAMAGLLWADPVSEVLPRVARRPFRQAVLHVDPATALAYDGAGFDRLRAPEVYFEVPLASSLVQVPTAAGTALLWTWVALVTWGAGSLVREEKSGGGGARPAFNRLGREGQGELPGRSSRPTNEG